MANFKFLPLRLTKEQIQDLFTKPETKSFNRICMQFYTTNGTEFSLVAQALEKGRKKIGPPVIFINPDGTQGSIMSTRDIIFGQYELSKSQLKKLSNDFTQDVVFKPKLSSINPESVDYDVNNGSDNVTPCPPAIPPDGE